jgi:TonB family protein
VTTGTHELRFRPLGRGTFVGGFFVTILIHAGLVGLVWYGQRKGPEGDPVPRDILVTQMVKLGKPREKFWLPRLVQPPKPKVLEPEIKVADDPNAKPTEKPKEKEKEKPEKPEYSKKVEDVLNRRRALLQAAAEEPPEGLPTGSASGTANTASEGDAYATQIMEAVRKNWTVPTGLSVGEVINFEAEIRIAISPDGEILRSSVHKSSGNSLYDDSCVQAVLSTRRVPPPPPAVRTMYRRGIALVFGGKDLAR